MFGMVSKKRYKELLKREKQLLECKERITKVSEKLKSSESNYVKLNEQFEQIMDNNNFLHKKNEELKKKNGEQKQITLKVINKLIDKMTVEELRENNAFEIWQGDAKEEQNSEHWYLYHNICSLGGCDFNGEGFNSEREALEAGARLTLQGEETNASYPCPSCYAEYQKESL